MENNNPHSAKLVLAAAIRSTCNLRQRGRIYKDSRGITRNIHKEFYVKGPRSLEGMQALAGFFDQHGSQIASERLPLIEKYVKSYGYELETIKSKRLVIYIP